MLKPGVYLGLAKQKSPEEIGEFEELFEFLTQDLGPEDATDGIYFWNSVLRSRLPENTIQLQTQPAPSCLRSNLCPHIQVGQLLQALPPLGPSTCKTQHLYDPAPVKLSI